MLAAGASLMTEQTSRRGPFLTAVAARRRLLVLGLLLLSVHASGVPASARDAIVAGSSADTPVPSSSISVIRGRIAVLSPIPLRGPLEVAAAHDTMLSRFEVRALRWIERKTGVSIATRPIILIVASFMALAPAGWFLADGIRRRRVGVSLVLGAVALAGGLATSVAAYEVEQLRRYERDDVPGVLQSYVDIFAGRGLDFDVITDWKGFLDAWSSEVKAGRLPYTVVAWAGAPAPSAEIVHWVRRHRDLPILHVALGTALRDVFRQVVSEAVEERWRSRVMYASQYETHAQLTAVDETLLREMASLPSPFALAQLERVGVLRLDDPGTSQNAYLQTWMYPTMTVSQWRAVQDVLARYDAQMSVGVVVGWVDDGDRERGELWLRGQPLAERVPGRVYPSRLVRYQHNATGWIYDVEAQARFFQSRPARLDFEVHGHTHLTPDITSWLAAPDRYRNEDWYREFFIAHVRPPRPRSAPEQLAILDAALAGYQQLFDFPPSTLIPPGHRQSITTAELARLRGFRLVLSRQTTILRRTGTFTSRLVQLADFETDRTTRPGPFPVILYLHDRDIVNRSPRWFEERMKAWRDRGVERFITARELAVRLTLVPDVQYDLAADVLKLSMTLEGSDAAHLRRVANGTLDFWLQLPRGCRPAPGATGLRVVARAESTTRALVKWPLVTGDATAAPHEATLPLACTRATVSFRGDPPR